MTQRTTTTARTRPWMVMLIVLAMLVTSVAWVAAQDPVYPNPAWEIGNYCVQDYVANAVCTANDVRIADMSPTIEEACLLEGDYATAIFTVRLVTGATDRYDIGLFVATEGGSALSGDYCYHDVLQPATLGPWGDFTLTYRNTDGDLCADTKQTDPDVYYTFRQALTVRCIDNDGDGVVDPFSTCTSWDNNANTGCTSVKQAIPGTGSKCRCETMVSNPPILIYRGYDWGDLPNSYGTTEASNGPRHTVQDTDNDGRPDSITDTSVTPNKVYPAVWLGASIDYSPLGESDGQPSPGAIGDDTTPQGSADDEDGVTMAGAWSVGPNGGQVSVNVNSSNGTCTGCRLGFWIDWSQDGDFDDLGESYVQSVVYGSQTVSFDIPYMPVSPLVYLRFRLYDGSHTGQVLPTGLVTNGEVEDYYIDITPTAVELLSFTATGLSKGIVLNWETASEIDNLGFNVYRATTKDGPRTQLNANLIPSKVLGMPTGAVYSYTDTSAVAGRTYYYWLEDVDIYGHATLHGPVSARAGVLKLLPARQLTPVR